MDVSCDLEVDINGEETFMVDKRLISSYSGKISKLFGKSTIGAKNLKLIFHDFPGGARSFELMARFCYNEGKLHITPLNLPLLHCVAEFMEMNKPVTGSPNLLEKTHKSLEEIKYWTWPDLLGALKQCQVLLPISDSSGVLHECLDSLMGRLALAVANTTSPCPSTSSPDSSTIRFSCDTRSTESLKSSSLKATWWFEDLVCLNPRLVEIVIKSMVSHEFDHSVVSKFLFYYHKTKSSLEKHDGKRKITEAVVDGLYSLDRAVVPCKSLFGILAASQSLKISKCCRNKLEAMIGSHMDQATLDNILVPSASGRSCLYDVDLVLRLLKLFLCKGKYSSIPLVQLKKVASLVDSYIAEVAPDPSLKAVKFLALIRSLPDYARESYDGIYSAVDMYLEAHAGLSEDEKVNICCGLNYEKLSSETCNNLAQNEKFPSKSAVQALISQQSKLKSLLQETTLTKHFMDSPSGFSDTDTERKNEESSKQIVLYAGKPDLSSENDKLRENLQGMQWRVMELEKVCKKMQNQMTKMMKSRLSSQTSSRSLPKMCS